jgi:CBS domain-containing protein
MDLARNLKIDSVARLQPTPPLRIEPDRPVADAVALMRQESVGCLLVCEKGQLVGIFTERDLMRRVLAENLSLDTPVAAVMTPRPVVVHAKQSIGAAVHKMEEGGYRHLPVLDEADRPLGVLSVKRIVHYLVEHYTSTVYNLPPNPAAVSQIREGA